MSIFTQLIDIIYPPKCAICGKFLSRQSLPKEIYVPHFCPACTNGFCSITSPLCPVCGMPFASDFREDHTCEGCLTKRPFFEAARAPYRYEGTIVKAVHQFKYGAKRFLADSLGPLLARYAKGWIKEQGALLTMPVPLHPKRMRERGFNQSLLLARHVARELQTDLDFLTLKRLRFTLPQTGLRKKERQHNVRGAFVLQGQGSVKRRTILLVDDVATTCATINECARVLMGEGADKVFCLTLAKAGGL